MNKDVIVTTIGDWDKKNGEYTTTVKCNDKQFKTYTDGWEGTSFEEVMELLNVLDIEPFVVHKRR